MRNLIHEIHRRSLWQVMGIYLVTGWIVLGAVGTLAESLNLPDWTPRFAFFLLIIGFPIVLATAFVQEGVGRPEAAAGPVEATDGLELEAQSAHHRLFTWRNAILGGVLGFSLLFGFAGLYVVIQDRGRSFSPQEEIAEEADPGIAFMPFEVSGAGQNLREGMVHLLYMSLDGAAGLRAIHYQTVLAQWDHLVGIGQRADLETAMQVAAATGARYALLGSVVAVGQRLRLSGDIYELPDGTSLGRVQAEGTADSLQTVVEELAVATLRALVQAGVETVPSADLTGVTTRSLPALTAYLEGEAYYRRGDFERALPHFEAALEADSMFALAHYRIAGAGGWLSGTGPDDLAHLKAAAEGNLTPRRKLIARVNSLNPELGEDFEDLRELLRRYPDDGEAWYVLGEWYRHVRIFEADWVEEAKHAFTRAADLDPGFASYMIHPIELAFAEYDAGEAGRWIERYGRASPGSESERGYRRAYSLIFEPTSDPLTFEAAIDTLVQVPPSRLNRLLGHPRASRVAIAFHLQLADDTGQLDGDICFQYALGEGRWKDFLTYAADPRLEPGAGLGCLLHAYMRDFPVPEELLDEAIRTVSESSRLNPEIWAGAYAASRGRWDEYEHWLAALRQRPEEAASVSVLEGYGQWQAGDLEQARETLEAARSRGEGEESLVRWWLGRIYLELGRPNDAAVYFSGYFHLAIPWTRSLYYLGLAYEEMGELQKAEAAYSEYLDIWKDADSELATMKQQARDALVRLGPLDQ